MSKSVRERALEAIMHEYDDEDIVASLAAAGLLATDALLACGEACIAFPRESHSGIRIVRAAAALAAERAGKPGFKADIVHEDSPDTSREDAALVDHLLATYPDDRECWSTTTFPLVAACRKAREPKPRYHVAAGVDKGWRVIESTTLDNAAIGLTEAQARAVADALNSVEAK